MSFIPPYSLIIWVRRFPIWVPLFLLWPVILFLALLIIPFLFLISFFGPRGPAWAVETVRAFYSILCATRGLKVDVGNSSEKVFVSIH